MKKFLLLGIVSILFSCSILPKKKVNYRPNWIKESSRSFAFPSDQFYVEFSEKKTTDFSSKSQKEIEQEFSKELENTLIKKVFEKISFSSVFTETQTDNKGTEYISSALNQSSRSASAILYDKKIDFYLDKSNKKIYGLLVIDKSVLAKKYKLFLLAKMDELNALLDAKTNDFNLQREKMKNLSDQMEVYSVIKQTEDKDFDEKYSTLIKKFSEFNNRLSDLNTKVVYLINEAEDLYLRRKDYNASIRKLNEALLYDNNNEIAIQKKKEYLNEWISVLNNSISILQAKREYRNALDELKQLMSIDKTNDLLYQNTQKNIISSALTYINEISKNGLLNEANFLYEGLSSYYYVDSNAFNQTKLVLDTYNIDQAIKSIDNSIYNSEYEDALRLNMQMIKKFPNDQALKSKSEMIEEKLFAKKKTELLNVRPTRWLLEFNYSLANLPAVVYLKPESQAQNFKTSDIDTKNLLPYYQVGLYKKIGITDQDSGQGGYKKHQFSYSQIGLRVGFLDGAKYPFKDAVLSNTTFLYDKTQLLHVEASYIWRSFFMFNVGYLTETLPEKQLNNTIKEMTNQYFSSTVGIRIPFSNPFHLTGEVTGFTLDGKVAKLFARAGVSWNIGMGKKYTSDDEKSIKNEISRIKNY